MDDVESFWNEDGSIELSIVKMGQPRDWKVRSVTQHYDDTKRPHKKAKMEVPVENESKRAAPVMATEARHSSSTDASGQEDEDSM